MVRPEQLGAEFVLRRWKFFAVWKEFFPEFSWERTPLACMWRPLDCCCTLEACAPRNPGRLRVSEVKFLWLRRSCAVKIRQIRVNPCPHERVPRPIGYRIYGHMYQASPPWRC